MTAEDGGADLAQAVGSRVRELRRGRGLSLSELARQAGLGKGTLSELESGRRNPTLETLYALSAPLGVGLAGLIAEHVDTKAGISVDGYGASTVLLDVVTAAEASTEIYRLTILPGPRHVSPSHGPGVRERLVVVTGRVRAGRNGALGEAGPGESLDWASDGEHSYESLTDGPVVAILVITHPV
ncbi:helix-turn-helix domain-containing protein [Nakamurella silvestris]|nr:helix-turn-helix domain-containing protein [Nakamurella silvestris]